MRTVDTVRGEDFWSAKLTEDQVKEIRRRYAAGGIGTRRLAKEYGVCQSNIRAIVTGKTWRHLLPTENAQQEDE